MCGMCVCVRGGGGGGWSVEWGGGGGGEGASFGAEILYPSFFGHAYTMDVKPISHKCRLVKKICSKKNCHF